MYLAINWLYRFNVLPILPTYLPWDLTLMPVTIMFLLQIKPNSNPLIKAILFALVTSYLAEPFFVWLEVYQPVHWHYTYSVPFQIIIYLIAHYVSRRNDFSEIH
ncbi:MAG: CBO0543 family protein [Bacillota bacterium]